MALIFHFSNIQCVSCLIFSKKRLFFGYVLTYFLGTFWFGYVLTASQKPKSKALRILQFLGFVLVWVRVDRISVDNFILKSHSQAKNYFKTKRLISVCQTFLEFTCKMVRKLVFLFFFQSS